ncbi:MAG: YihY/virulence factor BrkB family protein [Desulfobacterales bacterium]
MQNLRNKILKGIDFVREEMWRINLKTLPGKKSFFIRQLRIIALAIRGFDEDKCQLRASALTFYTLLSFVPVVAMAFGIAKGFGFEKSLEKQLLEKLPGQEEIVGQVVDFAHSLLENTQGGVIAGFGVVLLFWTVIKVLGHIEHSFNDVWEIKKARSFGRKFGDYLSIMLIAPILVITSSSVTVFIKTQIEFITREVALLGLFSSFIFSALKLFPYLVIWLLFTFIYILMPNTKVNFRSGLLAGIVAGTVFQISQHVYIAFQIGVARYNAIYGSFAALPLFLVWLQLSWLIVLFGAEISFAHQNVDTYEFESDCKGISAFFKKLLSLHVVHLLVKHFSSGKKPLTADEISQRLEIPIRLIRQILYELVQSDTLAETRTNNDKTFSYQPARDINSLTIKYVIDAMEKRGIDNLPVAQTKELQALSDSLKAFADTVAKSPENRLIKDI